MAKMRWLVLIYLMITLTSAQQYNSMTFVNRLKQSDTPDIIKKDPETWDCIARAQSNYDTSVIGYGKNYGIFQINDHWCAVDGSDSSHSICKTDCKSFIDEDITDDLKCVAEILKGPARGLKEWCFGEAKKCISNYECGEDEDFWDVGACVFPESCGEKDQDGDVCYPCNDGQCASFSFEDLVVHRLNDDKFKCCEQNNRYAYGGFHPRNRGFSQGQGFNTATSYFPTNDPVVIGCDDPDFVDTGCDRHEVKMKDDDTCYTVLSHGPCGLDGIVLVDQYTKKGYCAAQLCSADRVFLARDDKCHDPRTPGMCQNPEHVLYTNMYGEVTCGCPRGYYQNGSNCHQILSETNICPIEGEVFWFETFRKPPTCLPDPCKGLNIKRAANQLPFAPYKDGICYQIGSRSPEICSSDKFYFLNMETLEGECGTYEEAGFIEYTADELRKVQELYGPFIKDSTPTSPLYWIYVTKVPTISVLYYYYYIPVNNEVHQTNLHTIPTIGLSGSPGFTTKGPANVTNLVVWKDGTHIIPVHPQPVYTHIVPAHQQPRPVHTYSEDTHPQPQAVQAYSEDTHPQPQAVQPYSGYPQQQAVPAAQQASQFNGGFSFGATSPRPPLNQCQSGPQIDHNGNCVTIITGYQNQGATIGSSIAANHNSNYQYGPNRGGHPALG